MKRFVLGMIPVLILVPCGLFGAEYPDASSPGYYVLDQERKIEQVYEEHINALCREVELVTSVHMAVLTLSTTGNKDIKDYAEELYELWSKDRPEPGKGLLIMAAFDDHRVYTAVGAGLEDALAKSTVNRIHERIIIPDFKKRSYGKGIYRAIRLYAKEIEDAYHVEFESLEKPPYIYGHDDDWEEIEDLADDAARVATCCACWHVFHGPHWHKHWHWRWRRHHRW